MSATAWSDLRAAFEHAAASLPEEATDAELDAYWRAWADAMTGEADDLTAIRWKIDQFVTGAEDGGYRDDLQDAYREAIIADVERYAAKGGGQ